MGLIHEIAAPDKLVETAKAMIRNGLKPVAPWDEKGFKLPGGPVYSAAGANLWPPAIAILRRETYGNYPAAAAILKCVYEGLLVPFDTGLRIEQRYFTEIMQTKEAAAMIRSLFVSLQELNKGARRPAGVARHEVQEDRRSRRRLHGRRHRLCDGQGRHPGRAARPRHGIGRKGQGAFRRPDLRAGEEGPRQAGGQGQAAVADHADRRLCRPRRLRSRRRGGVRGFRSQEERHREGRGGAEGFGDLRLQHLDHPDHRRWRRTRRGRRISSASTSSRRSTR